MAEPAAQVKEHNGPSVAIRTVGCRLNQAESAQIAAAFRAAGYRIVVPAAPCDVFIVHSCTITGNAERDSLRLARSAARREPPPVVVLAGCAAEVGDAGLQQRAAADLVVGQDAKFDLPARVAACRGLPAPLSNASDHALPLFTSTRAIVRVQDGCRFRCSYCIVPQTRSRIWSRPLKDVIEEVRQLAAAGYREVVITGANLGCYRDGADDLVGLLARLLSDTSMPRLRLSSVELSTIDSRLIDLMAQHPRICRALHLPLQSGSDAVLERMRRRYRSAAFASFIRQAVAAIPRLGIGTDIITGFPGETTAAFEQTRRLIEALPFSNLHVFPFSPRPGTAAATLDHGVDPSLARHRARELIALGNLKQDTFAQRLIGQPVEVLVEKHETGAGVGWTSEYLPARVADPVTPNELVTFTPTAWQDNVLV